MFKKFTSAVVSAALIFSAVGVCGTNAPAGETSRNASAADSHPDYAEDLQKSLYFYECQQAGPLPEWNRVEWRADSTMTDEVRGGWYDAGDHVKFNLPMAYTASMLAWGLYQYPDGVEKADETTNYVNNLEFVLDYLAECDLGDEVIYQVGAPNEDGSYEDYRGNYVNNEVATDYNAGFTAILCKMLDKYVGKSDPSFPPKEVHDGSEFYVETITKGSTDSGITISFKVTNHFAWPARVQDNISFRYYMDLSEFVAAEINPEDVVIRCDRDQSAMYSGKQMPCITVFLGSFFQKLP